jgi:hypothetical protein
MNMTKKERTAKIKRIEKAIQTVDEVLADFYDILSFEQRCKLREVKNPLDFALKFHRA